MTQDDMKFEKGRKGDGEKKRRSEMKDDKRNKPDNTILLFSIYPEGVKSK